MKKYLTRRTYLKLSILFLFVLMGPAVMAQQRARNNKADSIKRVNDSLREANSPFWRDSAAGRNRRGRRDSLNGSDSIFRGDSTFRRNDTNRVRGGGFAAIFTDTSTMTTSDYQLQIEKTFLSLSNIENNSHLGPTINNLKRMLNESSEVLSVLKKNVDKNNTALNIKNLQVFRSLLQNIQKDLRDERALLDSNEKKLNKLRTDLRFLITDSILKQVMRTDTLRTQFASQLRDLRRAFFASSREMKESMNTINFLQTQTSSNSIITNQLLEDINNLLSSSAIRIFGKEYNYLWERDTVTVTAQARRSFDEVYEGETKAINYYFSDNGYKMFLLLLIGLLFYYWVRRNMRFLRTRQNTHELTLRDFEYLRYGVLPATFIVVFSIAPIFDLHAPAAYIETMQLFLLIAVTYVMYRKWPKKIFGYWVLIGVLFIVFSLTSHSIDPGFLERWFLVLLNIGSIIAASLFIKAVKETHHLKRFLTWVLNLHIFLNFLSIVFNMFGRYTLAQILGNAAIFGVSQALGLAIFSKVWLEAILAQMVSSRMRHGFETNYEFRQVLKSFSRPIKFLVGVLWLIVLTTNLNLYSFSFNVITAILQKERTIGSASFTLGGIALFFMIIWIAHLLQRYIGYFFGDTGDDEEMQSKGQRSRLLIARLVLLCIGYLLAVAASGIPVDKITIVLGALGVGIGLGLQNIVSNFVSGIILIFDRPLQIGDIVEIGDKQGKVREIGLRSSTILTQDGAEVIIPNGDLLSRQIVNWTLTTNQRRLTFTLTVSGSDDMELVSSVIKTAILRSDYVAKMRDPQILITKVNENGFELQAFCWCIDAANYEVAKSQINVLLAEELGNRGLTI